MSSVELPLLAERLALSFTGHQPAIALPAKLRHEPGMLVLDDLTVRIAGRALLENAGAQIPDGARVGLIGRNGAGKTTLFRVLSGDLAPEGGAIHRPARARIGRLAQEAPS